MELDGTLTTRPDGYHVVRFVRTIDRPIAKVWAAISDPALLKNWLGDVELEPRVGGKFSLRFTGNGSDLGTSGVVSAFEPERVFEYSWFEPAAQSVVRWELAPAPQGCTLTLTHTFPPEMARTDLISYLAGWHAFADAIAQAADGEIVTENIEANAEIGRRYMEKLTGSPTVSERGATGRAATVRFERQLAGPVERVWDHLTKTNLLPGWFGEDSRLEPRLGGAVWFMGGHIRGTITQWQPPNRLAYTWNVFNPDDGPDAVSAYPESYLTFTLEPYGETVLLTLTHLPILERFEKQNAMGWHTMLDILSAALRGEKVEPRPVYMQKNAALYGVDMSNLAR